MSEDIWARLKRSAKLPTPPRVALEVLRMAGRDDVSVGQVAALIEKDAALAARLLKTVNRAFYGVRRQVGSVRQAAVLLGLRAVKLIALNFSIFGEKQMGRGVLDYEAHWRRSLVCGIFASKLAPKVNLGPVDEAYVAGLLAHIGVLVLCQCMPDRYGPVLAESAERRVPLAQVEASRLGVTHGQVGQWLLDKWQLPEAVCEAIGAHHNRPGPEDTSRAALLAGLLFAADLAASAMEDESTEVAVEALRQFAAQRFGLSDEQTAAALTETEREIEETRWLLDLGPIRHPGCDEMLQRAAAYRAQLKGRAAVSSGAQ
jgi:HD-like signal output (HDOD) protein